jgi:hypothetical protein
MIRTRLAAASLGLAAATITGLTLLGSPAGASTPASAAVAPTTASPATTTPTAASCDRAPWEAPVQGTPHGFTAGDRGGDYLWHDASGFHLRVTHKGDHRAVYTGVITSSRPMRIDPVKLEKGDIVKLSANHRTLTFSFADYGRIDGVNFHTDCAGALNVSRLHVGNASLPRTRVYLGATKAHPKAVPFTVHRR